MPKQRSSPETNIAHPPKAKSTIPQPYIINDTDILEDNSKEITVCSDVTGKILHGYYRIIYRNQIQTLDIVSERVSASATGHFVQGVFDGKWLVHFFGEQDGLDYLKTYNLGVLDGSFIVYRGDNSVCYETVFKNGNGLWKSFHPNGQLMVAGSYYNGKQQGEWISYYSNGLVKEKNIYERGVLQKTFKP